MKGTNMKGPRQLTIVIKLGESLFASLLPAAHPLPTTISDSITGTSSIVDEVTHQPILSILSMIVETAIKLLQDGHKVIIVSSGAIGVGLRRMEIEKKPSHLPKVQVQTVQSMSQCVFHASPRSDNDTRPSPQSANAA
jgi:hypothetical protein